MLIATNSKLTMSQSLPHPISRRHVSWSLQAWPRKRNSVLSTFALNFFFRKLRSKKQCSIALSCAGSILVQKASETFSTKDVHKIMAKLNAYGQPSFLPLGLFKILQVLKPRYIKVKVENYLLFMFSPPKISWVISVIKYICLHLLPVFYLIQPSSKQIICFVF